MFLFYLSEDNEMDVEIEISGKVEMVIRHSPIHMTHEGDMSMKWIVQEPTCCVFCSLVVKGRLLFPGYASRNNFTIISSYSSRNNSVLWIHTTYTKLETCSLSARVGMT